MGRAMSNTDSPIMKGSSGVLVLRAEETLRGEEGDCIRCAKCVDACPMGLEPYLLANVSKQKMYDMAEQHFIFDCIECGCCTYTCPSNLPLLDYLRLGKAEVMKIMRGRKA